MIKLFKALAFTFFFNTNIYANTQTINPISDGALYVCGGCNTVNDGAYVLVAGYIQGSIKFSNALIPDTFSSAFLTVNPYGLPLWGKEVNIYGYGTSISALNISDADAGTFLGKLTLPDNLGYGQDAYFDVTTFISQNTSPFVGFNLRSPGTNVFSSLEYNYGHPSQLVFTTATAVPEPKVYGMFLMGLGLIALRVRKS